MSERKFSVVSIILYVIAVLLFIYFIVVFYNSVKEVSRAVAEGYLEMGGNRQELTNYVVGNSLQYIMYALILSSLGFVIQEVHGLGFRQVQDKPYIETDDIYEIEEVEEIEEADEIDLEAEKAEDDAEKAEDETEDDRSN